MSSVRRAFYYVISLVTLSVMAAGVGTLLYLALNLLISGDAARLPDNFTGQHLALGLAELIIAAPIWFFFWRSLQRQVQGRDSEIGSSLRQIYLNLILTVTALVSLFMSSSVLVWLMGGAGRQENASGSLAALIVVVALWFYHWRVADREGRPSPAARTLRRWYVYIVSAWGLVWLVVGLVQVIYGAAVYLSGTSSALIRGTFWTDNMRTFASWLILGGLWWGHHWFRLAKGDVDSTLRQVYIYLLAIVGGSVAGLIALVFSLERLLARALNNPDISYYDYYKFLGWTLPLMVISLGIVVYHQTVSQEEAGLLQERRLSSRRVHLYILSFLGLGALVAGILILLNIPFGLPLVNGADWWKNSLSVGIALLLVAIPLFWYYWRRILALAQSGVTEWKARSRRIYFYLIIVASVLGLVGGLVNLIYQFLNGALTGVPGLQSYRHAIVSFQAIIASAPLLFFHWRQVRNEQRKGAEAAINAKAVILLGGPESERLSQLLGTRLGYKVGFWRVPQPIADVRTWSDEEIDRAAAEIGASSLKRMLVADIEGKIRVFPFQEK